MLEEEVQAPSATFLLPFTDVFSAGCCPAGLFCDSDPPLDFSQMLVYRVGEHRVEKFLARIEDEHVKEQGGGQGSSGAKGLQARGPVPGHVKRPRLPRVLLLLPPLLREHVQPAAVHVCRPEGVVDLHGPGQPGHHAEDGGLELTSLMEQNLTVLQ